MAANKDQVIKHSNVLGLSGLSSKSITGVEVYAHGAVIVVEINYSGGTQYIKVKQNQAEVGGTIEWGTGTQVI
jgi:hypothetical protein